MKISEVQIYLLGIGGRHPILYRRPEHYQVVDHAPERDIQNSTMPIPDRPGLGVELAEKNVRPFLWAERKYRENER